MSNGAAAAFMALQSLTNSPSSNDGGYTPTGVVIIAILVCLVLLFIAIFGIVTLILGWY